MIRSTRPRLQTTAPRRAAFTLIEMIMVVALLGMAASLLIPNMMNMTEFETEAAVRRLVTDFTFAQSDAVARQRGRRVLFEEDGSGYRLLGDPYDPVADVLSDPIAWDGDGQCIINYTTDERFLSISISNVGFDANAKFITFNELGGAVAADGSPSVGGSVTINGTDGSFRVDVAAFTGRVSVTRL